MASVDYSQVSKERYNIIMGRYIRYLDSLNDETKEPVRVFDPLPPRMVDELELIREVSKELQNKKDEDLKKAAQAATQAAEEAAKKAAEEAQKSAEENQEEKEEKTE